MRVGGKMRRHTLHMSAQLRFGGDKVDLPKDLQGLFHCHSLHRQTASEFSQHLAHRSLLLSMGVAELVIEVNHTIRLDIHRRPTCRLPCTMPRNA